MSNVEFGRRPSAFQANRFKRTITITMNEEMADELFGTLHTNRNAVEDQGSSVSSALYNLERNLEKIVLRQPGDTFKPLAFEGKEIPSERNIAA